MFYRFLNGQKDNEISKLHPVAVRYLSEDLAKTGDQVVSERFDVTQDYALLHRHFEGDQKRLYMINKNYVHFLRAIVFLYKTSQLSVASGVMAAPANIYQVINAVQDSFKEMTQSLSLK